MTYTLFTLGLNLRNEWLKTRRGALMLVVLLCPLLLTLLNFLIFYGNADKVIEPGSNPWEAFFGQAIQVLSIFFLALYCALIAPMLNAIEHKAGSFKLLYALPQARAVVYLGKLLYLFLLLALSLLVYVVLLYLAALPVAAAWPDFGWWEQPLLMSDVLLGAGRLWVTGAAILAIHQAVSYFTSHFGLSLGVALVGTAFGLQMIRGWEYAWLWPYVLPLLAPTGEAIGEYGWISHPMVVSGIYIALATGVGLYLAYKRRLR